MATSPVYPVRVEGTLDGNLSRWLWLVKWFLAIPHYIVLAFLWLAFWVLSVFAFFAILFTGRYPKAVFEFNVGVLRWSWRVGYYAFSVLGTDRYPPFSLAEAPEYPAHFDVAYPERLSRGLVLVKWWLLAIPHYLIVAILMGGAWWVWQNEAVRTSGPGLIGLLVIIAAVILAATGNYPRQLFDLILGLNRWVLRVAAYAGLMTDEYPPFRLDMGGSDDGATVSVPPTSEGSGAAGPRGWTPGPILSLIAGGLVALLALGALAAGGAALWADRTQRDADGFVSTSLETFTTSTHAIVSEDIEIRTDGPDLMLPSQVIGNARVRVVPDGGEEIFVGLAPAAEAARYLTGTAHSTVRGLSDRSMIDRPGGAPARPAEQTFWAASSTGRGVQGLTWSPREGAWSLVIMNADGSAGVDIRASAGAEVPVLSWIAGGLLVGGGIILLIGIALIAGAIWRATRRAEASAGVSPS